MAGGGRPMFDRRIVRALAAVVLLIGLLTTATADLYDDINNTTNQLSGVNGSITGIRTHLQQLLAEEHMLQAQIWALNSRLKQVAQQIQQETARLDELQVEIDAAKAELALKEAQLKHDEDVLGRQMRVMYKSGTVNGFELVFSASNFTDLMNRIFFFNDVVQEDRRQVEALRKERARVAAMKADLDAKFAQQAQVVATIKAQQAQIQQARDQRAGVEAQVRALAAQFQRELDQMQAQRARLQAQLQQLIQESLRAGSTGHFMWPLGGVITQGFGCTDYPFEPYDPNCPSRHFHSGIDIAGPYGEPVHAADGGIVHNFSMVCGAYLCGYGHYVIVVHANGFTSLYGHLSGYAIADGTQVGQGTTIGYEGSTGNSTGAHCHFEIDLNGSPVNPLAYLP